MSRSTSSNGAPAFETWTAFMVGIGPPRHDFHHQGIPAASASRARYASPSDGGGDHAARRAEAPARLPGAGEIRHCRLRGAADHRARHARPALVRGGALLRGGGSRRRLPGGRCAGLDLRRELRPHRADRSEEHTSELQSPCNLVCRLLLSKNKKYLRELALAHAIPIATPTVADQPTVIAEYALVKPDPPTDGFSSFCADVSTVKQKHNAKLP